MLVPVSLHFESKGIQMDAKPDVAEVLSSPVFASFQFASGQPTQYADAMLRATFPSAKSWHTLLSQPVETKTVKIRVPAAFGYVLTSRTTNSHLAVADVEFIQHELFRQIGKQDGKLIIAVTHNTAYYTQQDATICCSWGTHGTDSTTGDSFVLASYLSQTPPIVEDQDIQPLTQQMAEFVIDPLHDPLAHDPNPNMPGNRFPRWLRPSTVPFDDEGRCGGTHAASAYFLLEPTDTNKKNNLPASKAFVARSGERTYHVENVALLSWYIGASPNLGTKYSFPDAGALVTQAHPCPARGSRFTNVPTATASPRKGAPNGHRLIGYWTTGSSRDGFPLPQVSPQWDVVIVAFAAPDHRAPEGTLQFQLPEGVTPDQFKQQVADLKRNGRKVLISLGGGGEYFTLGSAKSQKIFVTSVTGIVSQYGFDGIDLDFESPSFEIQPGDTDFRHPKTPSIVNLISALRDLRNHFGPDFMISLVPEGTQFPAAHASYGGQFGSYLPIAFSIRDILSFIDVQDYNTPPLEGLDGEIYQSGSVNYHGAMTELLLRGFTVAGGQQFPPIPANKVAVGYLADYTTPAIMAESMEYLITGEAPTGTRYKLLTRGGYPSLIGAMLWNINADRLESYKYSNLVGTELHSYPAAK